MAADNDLAIYGKKDIISMESVPQPSGLNIIVQADFPALGSTRYRISNANFDGQNISSPVISQLGTIDSGDPTTLREFVNWGLSRYTSDRKMLVIWSHADSWFKKSKWISPDEDTGNVIGVSNGELKQALQGLPKLDIILFDACSMQGIEILSEIHNFTDYVIASADEVPVWGFPYERIIPILNTHPASIASQIPNLYTESYAPGSVYNPHYDYLVTTCSSIETGRIPEFMTMWKQLSHKMRQKPKELISIRSTLHEMNTGYADVDLLQFLKRLSMNENFPEAGSVLSLWEQMIIASSYTLPWIDSDLGTAAIWFPSVPFSYNSVWKNYMNLEFSKTGWLGVVNLTLGEDVIAPEPPILLQQTLQFSTLKLHIKSPVDVDSIYYRFQMSNGNTYFTPDAYSSSFWMSFPVDRSDTYKLYAIDQSGNESAPLQGSLQYHTPQIGMMIHPNPIRFSNQAMVSWYSGDSLNGNITISIYNVKGQLVFSEQLGSISSSEGSYLLNISDDFKSLAPGVHILKLKLGKETLTHKLTILY